MSSVLSTSARQGLRYEKKVDGFIRHIFRGYEIQYQHRLQVGYYPDWLVHLPDYILIVECKLTHSLQPYKQLRHQYQPAVARSFHREVRVLEVCKQYDPRIVLPEAPVPIEVLEPSAFLEDLYYVYPWTGR